MKRYRIFGWDIDSRSYLIKLYREKAKLTALDKTNYESILQVMKAHFGEFAFEMKVQNLIDISSKPVSIIAYHSKFLEQIRNAFIAGAYYPALTSACALGERILNHLLLNLRDQFKSTPEYKLIHRKQSFDNWDFAINTLTNWNILLPSVSSNYHLLRERRNKSIHFNLDTDLDERQQALDAIILIQLIIGEQFSAFGSQPWFIADIPGEIYLKSSWESNPFIQLVYLPNSVKVGYKHRIESIRPKISILDDFDYEIGDLTDEEFSAKRINAYR